MITLKKLAEADKATIAANITNAVVAAEGSGLVSRPAALKELRQSSDVTGVWSNVTDEEIEAAVNEPPPMPEIPAPEEQKYAPPVEPEPRPV